MNMTTLPCSLQRGANSLDIMRVHRLDILDADSRDDALDIHLAAFAMLQRDAVARIALLSRHSRCAVVQDADGAGAGNSSHVAGNFVHLAAQRHT